MCICVCPSVCTCPTCVLLSIEARRGHWISWWLWLLRATGCWCWQLNRGPLQEQQVLSTSVLSLFLAPFSIIFKFWSIVVQESRRTTYALLMGSTFPEGKGWECTFNIVSMLANNPSVLKLQCWRHLKLPHLSQCLVFSFLSSVQSEGNKMIRAVGNSVDRQQRVCNFSVARNGGIQLWSQGSGGVSGRTSSAKLAWAAWRDPASNSQDKPVLPLLSVGE